MHNISNEKLMMRTRKKIIIIRNNLINKLFKMKDSNIIQEQFTFDLFGFSSSLKGYCKEYYSNVIMV